jgi:hypothetical protein
MWVLSGNLRSVLFLESGHQLALPLHPSSFGQSFHFPSLLNLAAYNLVFVYALYRLLSAADIPRIL